MLAYQYEDAIKAKLWKKILAVVLAAVLVVGALVELLCETSMVKNRIEVSAMMSDYAKDIVDTSKATAIDKETMEEDNKVLAVKNRDGSNTAYIFSEPIYYEDDDGNIRTKDISINKVKDKSLSELGYAYENGQNDIRIQFSKDPAVGTKVSSDSWAYSLSPVEGDASINGEKVGLSYMGDKFEAFQYKGLYGTGSALNFYPELNGLKDEIILSSAPKSPVFEFTLATKGATADLNKDGTISIIDKKTKEAVQTLNAPFAYDADYVGDIPEGDPHFSPATFTLSSPEKKDGQYLYTLRIVLDETWLKAKSTSYPITIDPSSSTITNYFDTAVYSNKATTNYGTATTACFGRSSTYGYGRVLVFFVLPDSISAGCTINSAYYWFRETTGRTTSTYLTPYMIGSTWNETTATWNNKPSYYDFSAQPTKCINGNSTDSSSSKHWYAFDIQTAVNAWAQGWGQNLGLCFVSNEETDGAYNWRAFATRDYTTSSYRPYAVVNYSDDTTPPTATGVSGNATYWTNQNVTLSVDGAADSGSGLAAEAYSFSRDPNTKYWQSSNTKTFTENCTVYIHLRDAEGNIADLGTQIINCIDKVKPSSPTVTGTPTSWTNQ
ncbi:MAG: DNRLRE domain-containing protein, partial [Clostridia bacterium]|nr:DNRLRE domain-containing protein [Clostridia bacterium]